MIRVTYSVHCELGPRRGGASCMGWIAHALTRREALAIAKRARWERITDPDDQGQTIDACPPCAFNVKLAATKATQPERTTS